MFRLLICDDHSMTRIGMRDVAARAAGHCDTTEAGSARELLEALRSRKPFDLLILDIRLPDRSGLSVLPEVKELRPELPVWVTSADEREQTMTEALNAGASSYLPKTVSEDVMFRAMRDACRHRIVLPANYRGPDTDWDREEASDTARKLMAKLGLSPRQQQVLALVLEGSSRKQIAQSLGITDGTAKSHIGAVYAALEVRTRAKALIRCSQLGIPLGLH
jgi:DNA-binding NarL/FixJ family response regulator